MYLREIDEQPNEQVKKRFVILVLFEHRDEIILQNACFTQNAPDLTHLTITTQITYQIL